MSTDRDKKIETVYDTLVDTLQVHLLFAKENPESRTSQEILKAVISFVKTQNIQEVSLQSDSPVVNLFKEAEKELKLLGGGRKH